MPVIHGFSAPQVEGGEDDALTQEQVADQEAEAALADEDGNPTLEADVMANFLSEVDFTPFFEDEEIVAQMEEEIVFLKVVGDVSEDDDADVEVEQIEVEEAEELAEDENAIVEAVTFEVIPGEVIAENIDYEDLMGLFEYHLREEIDADTLEGRTRSACFDDLFEQDTDGLDEDQLDEKPKRPFKKGDFRKFQAKSVGHRARMFAAMLKKGAIKRVGKGKGYKGGGYAYSGAKTKSGTPKGKKMYRRMRKKGVVLGTAKKLVKRNTEAGRRAVVKRIYRNIGAKMPKGWVGPEMRLHQKAVKKLGKIVKSQRGKAAKGQLTKKQVDALKALPGVKSVKAPKTRKVLKQAAVKKKPTKAKKKKSVGLAAHDKAAYSNVTEGHRLAGQVGNIMEGRRGKKAE